MLVCVSSPSPSISAALRLTFLRVLLLLLAVEAGAAVVVAAATAVGVVVVVVVGGVDLTSCLTGVSCPAEVIVVAVAVAFLGDDRAVAVCLMGDLGVI